MGGEELTGLFAAGLGVGAQRMEGVGLAAGAVGGEELRGFYAAGGYLQTRDLEGVGIATVNRANGVVEGLMIGIFNYAGELHGMQVGLLNYAGNNRKGLRLLPLVNAHFD